MSDPDQASKEKALRSVSAVAFRYDEPKATQRSAFSTFDISPEQSKAIDEDRKAIEERAKNRSA